MKKPVIFFFPITYILKIMIIVQLKGGLGNQMFQYAAARALADRHRVPVRFDLSYLNNEALNRVHAPRPFALGAFNLPAAVASPDELRRFRGPFGWRDRLMRRFSAHRVFVEPPRGNPALIAKLGKHTLLEGFFQSQEYFLDIAGTIRRDFTRQALSSLADAEISKDIRARPSVSVHVRRGDFVSNPAALSFHGLCGPGYYRQAADLLLSRAPESFFFIFSDDPGWCREHLAFIRPGVIVPPSLEEPWRDLVLMSLCRHHIIANSSFSWWGAWLNPRQDKMAIAPDPWYADSSREGDGLVPGDWIRLPRGR